MLLKCDLYNILYTLQNKSKVKKSLSRTNKLINYTYSSEAYLGKGSDG